MRTTLAAALSLVLLACGGDSELSLTEPGQIDLAACGSVAGVTQSDYAGVWLVDQWGCVGRASPDGAIDCDAAALNWTNSAEITISIVDADTFTVSVDGDVMTADWNSGGVGGETADGDRLGIGLCSDGEALATVSSGDDFFGAFATRR